MENRQITPISPDTEEAILRKSAHGLPTRPSEAGMKPNDIKKAFFEFATGTNNSLISELKRIVAEANIILAEIQESESTHKADKNNPHLVTKSQVGLSNVDNTSDINKPISTAQQTEINKRVKYADIQDILTSSETNKPLSANKGRVLDEKIAENKSDIDLSIKNITIDSETGVLTITRKNGTTFTIDLPLEYLVKSGIYNATSKEIWLTLENDNTIKIPVADLIDEYFADGTTLTMYVDSADGNKVKFKISDTYKQKIDASVDKLASIENGANKNVQADWNQTNSTKDDYIKNKPVIPDGVFLYSTTGNNTNGAMTQKVTTEELTKKVNIAQDIQNANKNMTTNAQGNIVPTDFVIIGGDIKISKEVDTGGNASIVFEFPEEV